MSPTKSVKILNVNMYNARSITSTKNILKTIEDD